MIVTTHCWSSHFNCDIHMSRIIGGRGMSAFAAPPTRSTTSAGRSMWWSNTFFFPQDFRHHFEMVFGNSCFFSLDGYAGWCSNGTFHLPSVWLSKKDFCPLTVSIGSRIRGRSRFQCLYRNSIISTSTCCGSLFMIPSHFSWTGQIWSVSNPHNSLITNFQGFRTILTILNLTEMF